MKQSYPINTLDLHDSGPRSASNARTLSSYGIAPKTDAKKSGSPLFFRTSSIQQAKRRLKSSHEHTSIKSQQLLSKTGENFLVQSQSLWPFTAATPEHDRSTNLNYLLNDNSNQTTHRASNPDEPVHRAKQNLTGRHVKKYNHPANPKVTTGTHIHSKFYRTLSSVKSWRSPKVSPTLWRRYCRTIYGVRTLYGG